MSSDLAKDRFVSNSIINYLLASYQGKFTALSSLMLTGAAEASDGDIAQVQQTISKIVNWRKQLLQDECLFSASWTTPETFDAQNALDMLSALKGDLYQLSLDLVQILTLKVLPTPDQVKFLLSSLARSVYGKDTFIRGHIDYGTYFGLVEVVQRFSMALPSAEEEIRQVHKLLNVFRSSLENNHQLEEEFYRSLYFVSMELPFTFRSHIHDINQLLSQFSGGFTFQTAEFNQAEAAQWQDAGFGPVPAGYWRAYGISPEEAKAWSDEKFIDASMAYRWRTLGFTPESGAPWLLNQFSPDYAAMWAAAGYTAEQAMDFIQRGVRSPPPPSEKEPQKNE